MDTFSVLYPQLQDIDFRRTATDFDIPMFFVQGAHEADGRADVFTEWYPMMTAPIKELSSSTPRGTGPCSNSPTSSSTTWSTSSSAKPTGDTPPLTGPPTHTWRTIMTTELSGATAATILDNIRGTRDALSVRRVFGDPHELDGVTIIPVARISGAAGGGGGEGTDDQQSGSGFGTGFGVRADPVGIYRIRDGEIIWKPTIDITRLVRGCQVPRASSPSALRSLACVAISRLNQEVAVLEFDEATKRFGALAALDACSFTARPGRLTGFLGPNGAGKTTAMRTVFGLVELDSGAVRWQGAPIGPAQRARFGYMPEERGLYPRMRVRDQLVYLGRLCGRTSVAVSRTVDTWLERLGLSARADDRLDALSHGNQQRVQLIAALVNEPELLVLDEPFSGLDPLAIGHVGDARRGRRARERRCCSPATNSTSSRTSARTSSSSTPAGSCAPVTSPSCGPRCPQRFVDHSLPRQPPRLVPLVRGRGRRAARR